MVRKILSILIMAALMAGTACSDNAGKKNQGDNQQNNNEQTSSGSKDDGGMASINDDESQRNILQIAAASEAHTTLAKAVKAADLANTLANPGPFTAFAPTDEAFNQLPDGTLESLMKPENKKKLADILQRHVAPISHDKEDLKKMAERNRKLFMANGDNLSINVKNGDVYFKDAKIVKSIKASNGMIHVVDKVVVPEK